MQWTGVRLCSRATHVCPAQLVCVRSYSRLWWPCSMSRNESKRLRRNYRWMFQVCELGLPCKVWKFDSESSVSCGD
jgi:hypothetical protein